MHSVNNTPFWNKLFNEQVTQTLAALDAIYHNPAIYKKLVGLQTRVTTPRQKMILRKFLNQFEIFGASLTGAEKERFAQNRKRISELQTRFDDNIMAAAAAPANQIVLTQAAELGEMPDYVRDIYQKGPAQWQFSPSESSYKDFMSYCPNRKLRERMYHKYHTLASHYGQPEYNNLPLITEVLNLRQEQAQLLGYANHAAVAFQSRMEQDPKKISAFLATVLEKCQPKAQKEIVELEKFARQKVGINDLAPWDLGYISRKLKAQKYNYHEEELRAYFSADRVLEGLFACAGKLYDLKFSPCPAATWHEDLEYYLVEDRQTQTKLGYVRLDPFYRPNKFDTCWMSQTTPRRTVAGALQLPIINICCNFPARQKGQPSQLNLHDIWVLFHEFGHAVHYLTSLEEDYNLNVENTEADFVEMPQSINGEFRLGVGDNRSDDGSS